MPATVTADAVEKTILEALPQFGVDEEDVSRDSTFEDLDIDSLDLTELSQIIEDEYGVTIKGEDARQIKTVGDVIDMVVSKSG
jgi:acyl carrier protein